MSITATHVVVFVFFFDALRVWRLQVSQSVSITSLLQFSSHCRRLPDCLFVANFSVPFTRRTEPSRLLSCLPGTATESTAKRCVCVGHRTERLGGQAGKREKVRQWNFGRLLADSCPFFLSLSKVSTLLGLWTSLSGRLTDTGRCTSVIVVVVGVISWLPACLPAPQPGSWRNSAPQNYYHSKSITGLWSPGTLSEWSMSEVREQVVEKEKKKKKTTTKTKTWARFICLIEQRRAWPTWTCWCCLLPAALLATTALIDNVPLMTRMSGSSARSFSVIVSLPEVAAPVFAIVFSPFVPLCAPRLITPQCTVCKGAERGS